MPFNGSGTFVRLRNWVNDATAGIRIRADYHDSEDDNFASGLSQCITKDGQTTITGNQPMATYRHTNVGAASSITDYLRYDQGQLGKIVWAIAGGTANALTASYTPSTTTPVDGQLYYVRATAANSTTTPTFSPDGTTARTITKNGNQALEAGDINGAGHELILRYRLSDTKYELLNPKSVSSNIANSQLSNMAEATIKGRASGGGTGAPQDLTAAQVRTIVGNATDTTVGLVEKATQAEMEAETADKYADAALLKYHPAISKCWGLVTVSGGTPTLSVNYNVTSITDAAVGQLTVTIGSDFSSANYAIIPGIERAGTGTAAADALIVAVRNGTRAAGSFTLDCYATDSFSYRDPGSWSFDCKGDQ